MMVRSNIMQAFFPIVGRPYTTTRNTNTEDLHSVRSANDGGSTDLFRMLDLTPAAATNNNNNAVSFSWSKMQCTVSGQRLHFFSSHFVANSMEYEYCTLCLRHVPGNAFALAALLFVYFILELKNRHFWNEWQFPAHKAYNMGVITGVLLNAALMGFCFWIRRRIFDLRYFEKIVEGWLLAIVVTFEVLANQWRAAHLFGANGLETVRALCDLDVGVFVELMKSSDHDSKLCCGNIDEFYLVLALLGLLFICTMYVQLRSSTLVTVAVITSLVHGWLVYDTQPPFYMSPTLALTACGLLVMGFLLFHRRLELQQRAQWAQLHKTNLRLENMKSVVDNTNAPATGTVIDRVFAHIQSVENVLHVVGEFSAYGPQLQGARDLLASCRHVLANYGGGAVDVSYIFNNMDERAANSGLQAEFIRMLEAEAMSSTRDQDAPSSAPRRRSVESHTVLPNMIAETAQSNTMVGDSIDMDVLELSQMWNGRSLPIGGVAIFRKFLHQLPEMPDPETFSKFLDETHHRYHPNPYHNEAHALDVANACIILARMVHMLSDLPRENLLALVVSALAHDVGHPGLNNGFFQASEDHPLRIMYSSSFLENFHIAVLNSIWCQRGCNVLTRLSAEKRAKCRKICSEMILATDMAFHFERISAFRMKQQSGSLRTDKTQESLMMYLIKMADLGHCMKPWKVHVKWSRRVQQELFSQGDLELSLGMTVNPICDRSTVKLAKGQAGFLTFCVGPCAEALCDYITQEDIAESEETLNTLRKYKEHILQWEMSTIDTAAFDEPSATNNQRLLARSSDVARQLGGVIECAVCAHRGNLEANQPDSSAPSQDQALPQGRSHSSVISRTSASRGRHDNRCDSCPPQSR